MSHIKGNIGGKEWRIGRETTSAGDAIMDILRAIAFGLSWKANASILWAIFHTFCGPFYIVWNLLIIRGMF